MFQRIGRTVFVLAAGLVAVGIASCLAPEPSEQAAGMTSGSGASTGSGSAGAGSGSATSGSGGDAATDDATVGGSGSGSGSGGSGSGSGSGAPSDAGMGRDVGMSTGVDVDWAQWPMPPLHPTDYTKSGSTVHDNVTGLTWQATLDGSKQYSFEGAKSVCPALNDGGTTGWRLPSLIELLSIVDYTQSPGKPAINPIFTFSGAGLDSFWTSSIVPGAFEEAFVVDFTEGAASSSASTSNYVVCVTSSEIVHVPDIDAGEGYDPPGRYQDGGANHVIDTVSKLEWYEDGTADLFSGAMNDCPSGYRLPTIKELATVIDTASPPGLSFIDENYFLKNPNNTSQGGYYVWSSTPDQTMPTTQVWVIDFAYGTVETNSETSTLDVMCVKPLP